MQTAPVVKRLTHGAGHGHIVEIEQQFEVRASTVSSFFVLGI